MGGASKSEGSSGASQQVFGPQSEALEDLYGQAGTLFGQTTRRMGPYMRPAAGTAQQIQSYAMEPWRQQLGGGVYQGMGLPGMLSESLQQSMAQPSAMQDINAMVMGGAGNTYADAMRAKYIQDASAAQQSMLANLDARAAAAGMSGGSRHGIAAGQGMSDINRNLQALMAQTGYETFDKDLDRKLQIAQQADQGTLARQQMMQNMLGSQQSAIANAIGQGGQQVQNLGMGAFAPFMAPWQAMGAYRSAVGSPTVLGDISTDTSSKGLSASLG